MSDELLKILLQKINIELIQDEKDRKKDEEDKKTYQANYYQNRDINNITRFNEFCKLHKIKKD